MLSPFRNQICCQLSSAWGETRAVFFLMHFKILLSIKHSLPYTFYLAFCSFPSLPPTSYHRSYFLPTTFGFLYLFLYATPHCLPHAIFNQTILKLGRIYCLSRETADIKSAYLSLQDGKLFLWSSHEREERGIELILHQTKQKPGFSTCLKVSIKDDKDVVTSDTAGYKLEHSSSSRLAKTFNSLQHYLLLYQQNSRK
jgi:hypothetical protein